MSREEIAKIVDAYRGGATADMLQAQFDTRWHSAIWAFPPCSPDIAEKMAKQLIRCQANQLRYIGRVRLRTSTSEFIDGVVITDLPHRSQTFWSLEAGQEIDTPCYLITEVLKALERAFAPEQLGRVP